MELELNLTFGPLLVPFSPKMALPVVQNLFLHIFTIETWGLRSIGVVNEPKISSLEDIKLDFLVNFYHFGPKWHFQWSEGYIL